MGPKSVSAEMPPPLGGNGPSADLGPVPDDRSTRSTDPPDPVREPARARTGGGILGPVVPTGPDPMASWRALLGGIVVEAVFRLIVRRELPRPS